MFGSEILEVAIGLAFIYTLLSLICSMLTELVSRVLAMRSTTLKEGIQLLLEDPNLVLGRDNKMVIELFYEHPLIKKLSKEGWYDKILRIFLGWKAHPSYIPSRNFALALMDVITSNDMRGTARLGDLKNALVNLPDESDMKRTLLPLIEDVSEEPNMTDVIRKAQDNVRKWLTANLPNSGTRNALLLLIEEAEKELKGTDDIDKARELIKKSFSDVGLSSDTMGSLSMVIDNAFDIKGDVKKARESIEQWFDDSMDRVSGWYAGKAQTITLAAALVVSIVLNVNSINIAYTLSRNDAMRDSIVAAAKKAIDDGRLSITVTNTEKEKEKRSALEAASSPSPTPLKTAESDHEESPMEDQTANNMDDEKKDVPLGSKELLDQLKLLELPIGWSHYRGLWHDMTLVGWIVTAIAISLGAPFWFDVLRKLVSIRASSRKPVD